MKKHSPITVLRTIVKIAKEIFGLVLLVLEILRRASDLIK